MKVAVLGCGAWGTALALVLYENGHHVAMWSYRADEIEMLRNSRKDVDTCKALIGDALFRMTCLSQQCGTDAEEALSASVEQYISCLEENIDKT